MDKKIFLKYFIFPGLFLCGFLGSFFQANAEIVDFRIPSECNKDLFDLDPYDNRMGVPALTFVNIYPSSRPSLNYAYSSSYFVFRNNVWAPLADVNFTVCAGEKVKAELHKTGEWFTAGSWYSTPAVYFKDDFDWGNYTSVPGVSDRLAAPECNKNDQLGENAYWGYISAPAIFKNPHTNLEFNGAGCDGNVCTAPSIFGAYELKFNVSSTEARQRYYAKREPGWCGVATRRADACSCAAGCVGGGELACCDEIVGPPVESIASIPAWSNTKTITVKNANECSACNDPIYANAHPVECNCIDDDVCNIACNNPPDPDCNCGPDGICNLNCPYDPDCCSDPAYFNSHPQCNDCDADGICNLNCPYDPDCCSDPVYAAAHSECHCGPDGTCNPVCNPPDPECGVIGQGTCFVTRIEPDMSVTKVSINDPVKYLAKVSGGKTPTEYVWYCDSESSSPSGQHSAGANNPAEDDQVCRYEKKGNYQPKAGYKHEGLEDFVSCTNAQGVGITVEGAKPEAITSCSVFVSGDGGDTYSKEIIARKGDKIKAKVPVETAEQVNWKFNGVSVPDHGLTITHEITESGQVKVEALVGGISCDSASINVKETLQWNQ